MGKHNKTATAVEANTVATAVEANTAWYASQQGVAAAIAAAGAHWGAIPRVPASHRWLAAAAWVAGAANAYECNLWATAAAATMGWPVAVVPPVSFCKANWLFAVRRGTPYVQTGHGVVRAVPVAPVVTATPVTATP
jgi:hypothetical protein